jgi:hypothetical protein
MEFPKLNLQEFEKSKGAQRQKLSVQLDNICRNITLRTSQFQSEPSRCLFVDRFRER